jgi:hypothetical protein
MGGLDVSETGGFRFLEGPEGAPLIQRAEDSRSVLEACIEWRIRAVLLHASNMPPGFFDLSSTKAGTVLQKLRNYGVRLAVVCAPGAVQFSRMFPEMAAEEKSRGYFGVFESRESAIEWLASVPSAQT